MKKKYINPTIEIFEVRSSFAICDVSPEKVGKGDTGQTDPSGDSWNAPKRRIF